MSSQRPTPCPYCGGQRVDVYTTNMALVAGWTIVHVSAIVCTVCGHIAYYAVEPQKLRKLLN